MKKLYKHKITLNIILSKKAGKISERQKSDVNSG